MHPQSSKICVHLRHLRFVSLLRPAKVPPRRGGVAPFVPMCLRASLSYCLLPFAIRYSTFQLCHLVALMRAKARHLCHAVPRGAPSPDCKTRACHHCWPPQLWHKSFEKRAKCKMRTRKTKPFASRTGRNKCLTSGSASKLSSFGAKTVKLGTLCALQLRGNEPACGEDARPSFFRLDSRPLER